MTNRTAIENRVKAINNVHEYINLMVPCLNQYIRENGYNLKSGTNELFKKDKDALSWIVRKKPENIQAYFNVSVHSGITLYVKTSYQQSEPDRNGVSIHAYYERGIFLEFTNDWENLEIYNVQNVLKDAERIEPLREEIRRLELELRAITHLVEGR